MPLAQAVAVTAELALQSTFGTVALPFSHRGGNAVPVTVRIKSFALEPVEENGLISEQRVLTLKVIAGQTNFAIPTGEAEPVSPGDVFTYLGRFCEVMLSGISSDPSQQVYTLRCVQRKRDSLGVA